MHLHFIEDILIIGDAVSLFSFKYEQQLGIKSFQDSCEPVAEIRIQLVIGGESVFVEFKPVNRR